MPDQEHVLRQIDAVLTRAQEARGIARYDDYSDLPQDVQIELITNLVATIERLAPERSIYRRNSEDLRAKNGPDYPGNIRVFVGILNALRSDYISGYLKSVEELLHAEVFGDFLDMAAYLLDEGYKDAAAVLAGGVLEGHIRNLARRAGLDVTTDGRTTKASTLNDALAKANVYTGLDHKNVTAWLGLRNKAAHGEYDSYTSDQVSLLIQSLRDFLIRVPA